MQNRRPLFVKISIAVVSIILVGCTGISAATTPPEEAVSSISTIVVSHVFSTPTFSPPISSPSAIPNEMPTITSTAMVQSTIPVSTPTVHPTATETPAPIPTVPGLDVNQQVLWLLETNNGCQLPCWWGITPGQTTWDVTEKFFGTFISNIQSTSSSQSINYSPVIPLPSEVYEIGNAYAGNTYPIYTVRDGIVEEILTEVSIGDTPPGYLSLYVLPTFLTTYGQPSEVWLFTYRSPFEENDLPFIIILSYPEKGIIALYSDNGERQGDLVRGCPQENPVAILKLWSPDLNLTFEQIKRGSSAIGADRDYLSLEEATGMNVMSFYETFKNPENITCLETPANLWH